MKALNLILYILLCTPFNFKLRKKIRYLLYILIFIIFQIFIYYYPSTDYENYRRAFEFYSFKEALMKKEVLFYSLGVIIKVITINYKIYFFIVGSIFIVPILYLIEKKSKDRFLSLLMLYGYTTMYTTNILRQGIATIVFVIVIVYGFNIKKINKYIIVGLNSLFHTSSLLLLPFMFFMNFKYKKKILYIILILSFVSFLAFPLDGLFRKLAGYVVSFTGQVKYEGYSQEGKFSTGTTSMVYRLFVTYYFVLLILMIKLKEKVIRTMALNNIFNLFYFGIIMLLLFSNVIILRRLVDYFKILELFLIPVYIRHLRGNNRKVVKGIVIAKVLVTMVFLSI